MTALRAVLKHTSFLSYFILLFCDLKVEELLMEIKETEAEVARWKEACELEVEAGKNEIGERDKVVNFLSFVRHNFL